MQQIDIDLEKFLSYPAIKPGIIHLNGTDIYKHSPLSQPVLKHIENNLDNVVFKNLSIRLVNENILQTLFKGCIP